MNVRRCGWMATALMLLAANVAAQDAATDIDVDVETDAIPSAQADVTEPDFEMADGPVGAWRPLFDLRMRGDHVSGLPANRADLERGRFRARFGAAWDAGGAFAAGIAARAALGSDDNRDNLRNNDNERSNHAGLDQAWVRWRFGERDRIELGKAPLPLALTPLVWDHDLRPVGASASFTREVGGFDRWQWDIGAFDVDHPLADGPRLYATQFGWHWREGAPIGVSAVAGYLAFERLQPLARAGLARGNPVRNGHYADDYRLLDLQLAVRRTPGDPSRALEARLDLLRNLAAERARDAARASLTWGDAMHAHGWEVGYAYQRIQAAATLAAVNSDDWWFHAGVRGHSLTVGYGLSDRVSLRVAGFSETRDGLDEQTRRVLVDLSAQW